MFGYSQTDINAKGRQSDKTEAMRDTLARMVALGCNVDSAGNENNRASFIMQSAARLREIRGDKDNTIVNVTTQNASTFFSQMKGGINHLDKKLVEQYTKEYTDHAVAMNESDDQKQYIRDHFRFYQAVHPKDTNKAIESMRLVEMPDSVCLQWIDMLNNLIG